MKKMKTMENKNNTGVIGSGFLLGLLLGILLTLLITTKKGREILKELMDKVIQKISDLEKSVEEATIKPAEEIKKEIMHLAKEFVPEEKRVSKSLQKPEPTKSGNRVFFVNSKKKVYK